MMRGSAAAAGRLLHGIDESVTADAAREEVARNEFKHNPDD
jgi:hypothetical protein